MNILGPNELQNSVPDQDLCVGCGACIGLCPYFSSYKGKTANLFPCDLETGRCFAFCPRVEVDLDELSEKRLGGPYEGSALGRHLSVKISKAGPSAGTGNFQAGGTVSALIGFALKTGLIDGAVLTGNEGILPVPRLVTSEEDVYACSSSKYTAAPTLSALNAAGKDGKSNLGLVAVPCQAMAAASMGLNPLEQDDYKETASLVIGLFCTWALDYRAFDRFISKMAAPDSITKMDIPPPPAEVMEIYIGNEKMEIPLSEIRPLVPNGCSYCPDMTAEFSDISVGVLEGRPDMNTIIIRTEKGRDLVAEAEKQGYLVTDDIMEENLEHLKLAAKNKKKRAFAKAGEDGLLNAAENGRLPIFRLNASVLDKVLA